MMKKAYEKIILEVMQISCEDVLTSSNGFYGGAHLFPTPDGDPM